jgi:PAS domain S-box-containing protein
MEILFLSKNNFFLEEEKALAASANCRNISSSDSLLTFGSKASLIVFYLESYAQEELEALLEQLEVLGLNTSLWVYGSLEQNRPAIRLFELGVDSIFDSRTMLMAALLEFCKPINYQQFEGLDSKNILNVFVKNVTDVVWVKNLAGRYLFINESGATFLGKTIEDIVGNTDKALFSRDTMAKIRSSDIDVLRRNETKNFEFTLNSISGENGKYYLSMKAPIGSATQGLEGLVGIIRDITERKIAETRLLTAKLSEELAHKRKNTFLASMSHELRTPLSNIITSSDMLLTGLIDPSTAKGRDYFKGIKQNGENLLEMINSLLEAAKVDSGHFELMIEKTPLFSVIEEALVTVGVLIDSKEQVITLAFDEELPEFIDADAQKLKQALSNLLSNANKYCPKGSEIQFECRLSGRNVLFSVRDNGPGIDSEDMKIIFDSFERGKMTQTRMIPGTGLGLSLTKTIVELHQGTIEAKSSLGQGSDFIISIPIHARVEDKPQERVMQFSLA